MWVSREESDGVKYEELRPTLTHEAIVWLIEHDHIQHCISQNGDGLHLLSGLQRGPTGTLSELHGNVFVEVPVILPFTVDEMPW